MRARLPIAIGALVLSSTTDARAVDKAECKAAAEEGQALRDGARLGDARSRFAICAQDACPEPIRGDCAGWLEEVDARRPTVVLVARGPRGEDLVDVRVTSDGRELATRLDGAELALDPGAYTLRFAAPGLPPADKRVVVADGQKRRTIEVTLGAPAPVASPPPPPPSAGPRVVPWVLVGVAGAGLATFGVLQGIARSEKAELEDGCGLQSGCLDSELDPVRAKFVGSGIALGVAGAAGVGAILVWLLGRGDHAVPPAATLVPALAPGHAGVRMRLPLSF